MEDYMLKFLILREASSSRNFMIGSIPWKISLSSKKSLNDKRVPLVIIRLRDRGAAWWQSYKFCRYLDGLPPFNNWSDLKREMTSEFLPLNYRQSENRDRQPRHNSKSFTNISSHHHSYNISNNLISTSLHLQRRDNYFKYLNSLPCGSKEENFKREVEEINLFYGNKSLVACDEDNRHQPHAPPSICPQHDADQRTTTSVEECLEQPDELVDRLVAVEECQDADVEDNVNTLMDKPKTKTETVENFSNFEEDFVGDFPMHTDNLANILSMEVRYNFLLQIKHLCLIKNEALTVNYNDPFLQLSVKPLTIEVSSSASISRAVQRKQMCRNSNVKEIDKDLIVFD